MRITVLAVGKVQPYYREACDEYRRRLAHHATTSEIEVKEGTHSRSLKERQLEEAARLTAKVPSGALLVALTRRGAALTSPQLAQRVERWREGAGLVALLIGGADGLADGLIADAALRWSLGPLTLPHQLARVVVWEQLYRAFTIVRGEKYHRSGER
jgi:23S rRNA (pseudouridine1915-N3)-methyltransferase